MDKDILDLLHSIVDEYIKADRLFTAYDVTLAARARTDKRILHYQAKEEIHNHMKSSLDSGDYLRDLIDVNAGEMPFLYYPRNSDPSSYTHQNVIGRFSAIVNLPPADLGRRQDQRGRITVPSNLIRDIGLKHGMIAFVSTGTDRIVLYATDPGTYAATYLVDKDNNARISHSVVESANLTNKTYDFHIENHTIVVTGN